MTFFDEAKIEVIAGDGAEIRLPPLLIKYALPI
jgi:hypothetical protein